MCVKADKKPPNNFIAVPYISLVNANIILGQRDGEYVEVDRHFFEFCLRSIVDHIRLDENWYLERYPDVTGAIERGEMANARVHYSRYGYFENRMPYPIKVDAEWYLSQYSDVQEAIARKDYSTAQAHFDEVGFAEGRLPYPRFTLALEATEDSDAPTATLRVV
jgi:hypothetical protein